jgi:hypothetical protein
MQNDWFRTDVPRIIAETKLIYQRLVEKYPDKTLEATTIQKIIQERHWEESLPIYEGRFRDVVTRLGCLYIPKLIIPGPAFIFPMRSADGTYPRAQTKPLEGSALWSVDGKYQYVGDKEKYIGPNWLGNDPETIRQIIETQSVMCVEGPFDLLAMRLICPSFPIMSPLTKKVGKNHIAYLRILGVKRLLLMYDNEIQGEESMNSSGETSRLCRL